MKTKPISHTQKQPDQKSAAHPAQEKNRVPDTDEKYKKLNFFQNKKNAYKTIQRLSL